MTRSTRTTGRWVGSRWVGEAVVPEAVEGLEVVLFPVVRHGVSVRVGPCGGQFKRGVEMGMVKPSTPALTVGMPLPVDEVLAHVFPLPFTVNAIISLMLWL